MAGLTASGVKRTEPSPRRRFTPRSWRLLAGIATPFHVRPLAQVIRPGRRRLLYRVQAMFPSSQLKPEFVSGGVRVKPAASGSVNAPHQSRNEGSVQIEGLRITSVEGSSRR